MPNISVIIPVYNSEDFLSECIGGILVQYEAYKPFMIMSFQKKL